MPNYEYLIIPSAFSARDTIQERARLAVIRDLDDAGKQGFKVLAFDSLAGAYTLMREMATPYEYETVHDYDLTERSAAGWEFVAPIGTWGNGTDNDPFEVMVIIRRPVGTGLPCPSPRPRPITISPIFWTPT